MTDAAVVQIPRPKTPQSYDRGTTERTYQSLEQAIQNKHDKRGHLYLEPGKELVLTSDDSSAQYGIGLDVGGYIRIRDMSDGSIGTFSVAWAQVDGAAQEIANLQAYVDTADAALTGSVSVNAAAIAANDVSIAGIETEITAARDGETDLAAKFSSVEGVIASGDAAIASDVTTLTARVGGSEASLFQNAYFQEEFSGTAVPPSWTSWDNGTGTWVTRGVGDGYAFAVTPGAGANQGVWQNIAVSPGDKFLAIGEVRRTLGGSSLAGAGILVQWRDSGGSEVSRDTIVFATDATTSGVINSAPDGVSRWEKEVTAPAGAVSVTLYAMGHYSPFGSIAAAAGFNWRECNLRPISQGEANVSINATAIADIEGNLSASYALTVDANGRIAQMRLLADGTTSSVAFTADVFKIYDGSSDVAPFSVSGGVVTMQNVTINGSLMVNGSVNTTQLASGAVTNTENDQDDSALTPSNNTWTDVADFSFTSVGIGVQLRGSCEVDIFTDGTSPTAQVRILRGATVLKTSKVYAAVDAGSGFQKVEQSIALDYNDLPASGTYTYKLQARLNEGTGAVVVSTFDVTNRFLSATELKR